MIHSHACARCGIVRVSCNCAHAERDPRLLCFKCLRWQRDEETSGPLDGPMRIALNRRWALAQMGLPED